MFDSTLTLSRIGIILNIDSNLNDSLFRQDIDYTYKNFTTLFKPEQTELLRKFLDRVFNTGKLQNIEFFNDTNFYQLKCVVSQPGQALCIITNNVKHRRLMTELEEHNIKTLFDTYSDWVWSFDTNFTLITANRAFFEARRKANAEPLNIGDNIFKHVPESGRLKWQPIYERALRGEVIGFEEKRNNGEREYFVEIYLTPVYNDRNEIIGCLGVTRDITDRKNAQHEIEGYTAKLEEFAFKTSHELRKPIANIKGMADMLGNGLLDEQEIAKTVGYITQSVNELDTIVISMIELMEQYKNTRA